MHLVMQHKKGHEIWKNEKSPSMCVEFSHISGLEPKVHHSSFPIARVPSILTHWEVFVPLTSGMARTELYNRIKELELKPPIILGKQYCTGNHNSLQFGVLHVLHITCALAYNQPST